MKKALIDPTAQVQVITGWTLNPDTSGSKYLPALVTIPNSARVAEVIDQAFDVAPPLFWLDSADNVVADQWYYDTATQQIIVVPPSAPLPGTTGTQAV